MAQLNKTQTAAVQSSLEQFERAVREAMRAALTEAREGGVAGEVHDIGDESVADELKAVNSALAERHGFELAEVERARQRLAGGVIGVCNDCGGDIAVARLLANPVAVRCIDCESRHERTHAHAATPRL